MVFNGKGPVQWEGVYPTRSPEVSNYLASEVSADNVIVAYQTNLRTVVGYCTVSKITGPPGVRRLWLQPFEVADPPFRIHDHKMGGVLEQPIAVNGPVMLRELNRTEMKTLLDLAGGPQRVLRGQPPANGWKPRKAPADAETD